MRLISGQGGGGLSPIKLIPGILWAAMAIGCSSQAEEQQGAAWQCSGKRGAGSWKCEQRLVRKGQVVDDAPIKTVVASATAESKAGTRGATGEEIFGEAGDDWRNQLPTLDGNYPVAVVDGREPIVIDRGPPPEPEYDDPLFDSFSEEVVAVAPKTPMVIEEPRPKKPATDGYVVQLAAFRSRDRIDRFVAEHKLDDLDLNYYPTSRDGQIWHVISWGRFASQEEALDSWSRQSQTHPGIKVWIRSLKSLLAVVENSTVR